MTHVSTPIIIAGSGSSGTNLLKALLNRTREVAIGPELSLLNKEYLFNMPFEEIQKKAKRIVYKGVTTNGWIIYKETFKDSEEYGWTKDELVSLIEESDSLKTVIDMFFERYLKSTGKLIWGEKTPSNIYCYDALRKLYPESKLIHLTRDGRDVITSFIKRGMSPFFATMLWVYNTSFALKYRNDINYLEVSYETLVQSPEEGLRKICTFLGIDYTPELLQGESSVIYKADSWNNAPQNKISDSSIGKYKDFLKDEHKFAMLKSKISSGHFAKYELPYATFTAIMKALDYPLDGMQEVPRINAFQKTRFYASVLRDVAERSLWHQRTQRKFLSYPASIDW